jgi:protein-tyrosine-phosphatase
MQTPRRQSRNDEIGWGIESAGEAEIDAGSQIAPRTLSKMETHGFKFDLQRRTRSAND